MKIKVLFILSIFLGISNSEFFSSIEELKNLKANDEKLINTLKDFSEELETKSLYIKRKLEQYDKEHAILKQDVESYVLNPLNAFILIKRLSYDIEELKTKFDFINKFFMKINDTKIPREELFGAVEGIFRLQKTYDLKSEHLARGIIHNKRYRAEMTPSDIFLLAKEIGKFDQKLSADYIKIARHLNKKKNDQILKVDFLEKLFDFYNATGKYTDAVEILDEILEIDSDKSRYEKNRMNIELLSLFSMDESNKIIKNNTKDTRNYLGSHYTFEKESLILNKACNGKLKKPIEESSKLYCRYVSTSYFTKIAPFKVMEANLDPFIGIFLDVLSDSEINILKSIARKELVRAQVMVQNTTTAVSNVRVAQLSWQQDSRHKIYSTITRRVGDMSGLNMVYSEKWQIQNYGIGGFYAPHHDFSGKNQFFLDSHLGNRIATALFYLSDVEKGGGTVFPLLHIHVPAVKGTAVFWYNLNSSGEKEYLTRHAACPVLVGSKWVANKWIREHGQEFIRKCELFPRIPDETYYLKKYDLKDYGIKV